MIVKLLCFSGADMLRPVYCTLRGRSLWDALLPPVKDAHFRNARKFEGGPATTVEILGYHPSMGEVFHSLDKNTPLGDGVVRHGMHVVVGLPRVPEPLPLPMAGTALRAEVRTPPRAAPPPVHVPPTHRPYLSLMELLAGRPLSALHFLKNRPVKRGVSVVPPHEPLRQTTRSSLGAVIECAPTPVPALSFLLARGCEKGK
eukprot:Sspe_Gene.107739::Locus_86151_Transcript_1_1_Confidence_1.000_Length_662::g.107739::m.107739